MSDRELYGCLEHFVRGLISHDRLEECLKGRRRFRFWDTNERAVEHRGDLPPIELRREDIDAQLRRFLNGDLSARDLSDWAATLRLLGCFQINEPESDSSEVWDLLDELVSPDAWGPVTIDSVIDLRRRLSTA